MGNETELISLDTNDIKRRIFTIRGEAGDVGQRPGRALRL